jgi:hypothetical protein
VTSKTELRDERLDLAVAGRVDQRFAAGALGLVSLDEERDEHVRVDKYLPHGYTRPLLAGVFQLFRRCRRILDDCLPAIESRACSR